MFALSQVLQIIALLLVMYSIRLALHRQYGALAVYAAGTVLWGTMSLLQFFSVTGVVLVAIGVSVLAVQLPKLKHKRKKGGIVSC